MSTMTTRAGLLAAILLLPGIAAAQDFKANAAKVDTVAKAFDARQYFRMDEPCKAEYAIVSPNRKDVSFRKIDLKILDGESIANGAGSYTEQFNFSRVDFDCLRGGGRPNCINDNVSFGHLAVKPGSEPAMCRAFLAVIASCQGVVSFKPSKRGCEPLQWEKDFIKNGPPKVAPSRLGR